MSISIVMMAMRRRFEGNQLDIASLLCWAAAGIASGRGIRPPSTGEPKPGFPGGARCWKLYWQPDGTVYNPDPFQLSLSGPQGLGGGGNGPRGIGQGSGGGGGIPLSYRNELNEYSGYAAYQIAAAIEGASDTNPYSLPIGIATQLFVSFFGDLLWGGSGPQISEYQKQHTEQGAHPVAYSGIRIIVDQSPSASGGGGGRPLAEGDAPSPSQYEQWGRTANSIQNLWNLYQFHRGGSLDAQKYGASTAYANYVFGVYMAAHGYTLPETLDYAQQYAFNFSHYPPRTPMSPMYPSMPAANVANITKGFEDERSGKFGLP